MSINELVIARHGEAVCNVTGVVGGEKGCTGLTEKGRRQARRLAIRLADEHARQPFDLFLTAPRLRVRETAAEIAARLGLEPTVAADLRGPDHGECDGRPWQPIRAAFGGYPRHYPDRVYAAGAETWNQYLGRVGSALRSLLREGHGQRVLITGHRETVEAAHNLLLGLRRGSIAHVGFVTGHATLSRWELHPDPYGEATWKLAAHNDGHHLDGQPLDGRVELA